MGKELKLLLMTNLSLKEFSNKAKKPENFGLKSKIKLTLDFSKKESITGTESFRQNNQFTKDNFRMVKSMVLERSSTQKQVSKWLGILIKVRFLSVLGVALAIQTSRKQLNLNLLKAGRSCLIIKIIHIIKAIIPQLFNKKLKAQETKTLKYLIKLDFIHLHFHHQTTFIVERCHLINKRFVHFCQE